ncbi:hypothetical protein TNCT_736551 [Trichonephila clavata]|uniref:Uncharacterized protein n=1 Tax=Trichonephila clavata TaxID=2740835 RepID=A0A8X6HT23_TRICU|nr:hypothetical protein TNCT_736551 [Trichonephila clavata]
MRKLAARWMSHFLTLDHYNRVRMKICTALLAQFGRNKLESFRRLITVEACIHHYSPKPKILPKQWITKTDLALKKKAKTVPSSGKVIVESLYIAIKFSLLNVLLLLKRKKPLPELTLQRYLKRQKFPKNYPIGNQDNVLSHTSQRYI